MESSSEQWPLHAPSRVITVCMALEYLYTVYTSDFDSESDPDYDDSDSDFCCSDIAFVDLVLEKSVLVVEPREAAETAVDTGKVVVRIERRPHADKESKTHEPYELGTEEHLLSQHLFLPPSSVHNHSEAS